MSTYSKADRSAQWFGDSFSSAAMIPNCVVWHSTETFGWPGYSGGSMGPGYTVKPDIANKRLLWRAHFEDEESSRALVNAPGGVETNTANAVQVEIIGTCNPAWAKSWPGTSKLAGRDYLYLPDAPDWFLAGLADFARDMNRRHGIPLTSSVRWTAYPGSYGTGASQRMSFAQWRAFVGHCGHQHVPENDHGDPGALPMGRILTLAQGAIAPTPAPTPTPAPAAPQEVDMKLTDIVPGTNPPLTVAQCLVRGAYAYGQVISTGYLAKTVGAQGAQVKKQGDALGALAADVDGIPDTVKQILKDAAVQVSVDVQYPTPPTA